MDERGRRAVQLKQRLVLIVGLGLAALLALNGAARFASASLPLPPEGDVPIRSTPGPAAAAVVTHTVFLPFVARNAITFQGPSISFGYGWNVYEYWKFRNGGTNTTSLTWLKLVADTPIDQAQAEFCNNNRLDYAILLRLNHADAGAESLQWVADRSFEWAVEMQNIGGSGKCTEAFEIGNEPNLSGTGAYNGPVDPERYADQLCAAYNAIKAVDPNYIVVSAGLAPTGVYSDPTVVLDEEDFLRRMLARIRDEHNGDAGACFDVLGHHNYGFRTGHATSPTDEALCPSGMCFRGAERMWNILYGEYGVAKRIWSTEIGWLRDFNVESCLVVNPGVFSFFTGFENSDQEQADELVAAFQYARANWPWSGAMFVFNYDFNHRPPWQANHCYDEQGWFAVDGYPAESALENMPKP